MHAHVFLTCRSVQKGGQHTLGLGCYFSGYSYLMSQPVSVSFHLSVLFQPSGVVHLRTMGHFVSQFLEVNLAFESCGTIEEKWLIWTFSGWSGSNTEFHL